MIYVIATIELAAGKREAFLAEFHNLDPLVRREEGCHEYGPTVDVETSIPAQPNARPDVVTVVEKWESLEHLERHLMAPHMLEYRPRVKDLVSRVTLQVLEPAEAP
jgi:quinol monooxygenase YgiN